MTELGQKRIAIVCDWLKDWWWAEQVLFDLIEIFPQADIYSSIFFPENFPSLVGKVQTTFINKLPILRWRPKMIPFLRTYAFEWLDLTKYDIVISSASAESKGIITRSGTVHFCYCHTPTRYYWSHTHEYQKNPEFGWLNGLARIIMPYIFQKMRIWDFIAAQRVNYFIANSKTTADRIQMYYRRDSEVIVPGIDEKIYTVDHSGNDTFKLSIWGIHGYSSGNKIPLSTSIDSNQYYIAVCRVIPYKRMDLLVDAFNENWLPLLICTNVHSDYQKDLQEKSKKNIIWVFSVNMKEKITLLQHARAFLFPGEEDYWLAPIEAMLCGTPVIAYKKGGALETVTGDASGIFFDEQTKESVIWGISKFNEKHWDRKEVRKASLHLSKDSFQKSIASFISTKIQ